jgi:general stress protein YciG
MEHFFQEETAMANQSPSQGQGNGRSGTQNRGFASMSEAEQREIARMGGAAVSEDREHMAEIGRRGGEASAEARAQRAAAKRANGDGASRPASGASSTRSRGDTRSSVTASDGDATASRPLESGGLSSGSMGATSIDEELDDLRASGSESESSMRGVSRGDRNDGDRTRDDSGRR